MTNTQSNITDAQKAQYETEGFLLLERVLSTQQLGLLREEAQNAIDRIHAQMDALNTDVMETNVRNSRYFSPDACDSQPRLREFLFCDLMAAVCRATIGPNATLVYEQYVIKAAEKARRSVGIRIRVMLRPAAPRRIRRAALAGSRSTT